MGVKVAVAVLGTMVLVRVTVTVLVAVDTVPALDVLVGVFDAARAKPEFDLASGDEGTLIAAKTRVLTIAVNTVRAMITHAKVFAPR